MPLDPGTHLGPYEILSQLGAGGMGEVYRARDSRLGRDVAIKVSAEKFNERFEREAKVVASLMAPGVVEMARTLRGNGNSTFGGLEWKAASSVTSTDITAPSGLMYTNSLPSFFHRAMPALPFFDTIHFPDAIPPFAPSPNAWT